MAITTSDARSILSTASKPSATTYTNLSAEVPVVAWYLENRNPPHKKFYTVLVADDGTLVLHWGRIGTGGQFKVEQHRDAAQARNIGLRQVYAKGSKGYAMIDEELKFIATVEQVKRAHEGTQGCHHLAALFKVAKDNPAFAGEQKAAAKHYDSFIGSAEALLHRLTSGGEEFETVYAEYQALQEAWSELAERHDTAAATLQLTASKVQQRLMSA